MFGEKDKALAIERHSETGQGGKGSPKLTFQASTEQIVRLACIISLSREE